MISTYRQRGKDITLQIARLKPRRNITTALRLLAFAGIIWAGYLWFVSQYQWVYPVAFTGAIALFALFVILDSKITARIALLKELRACCETEIAYLNGDFSRLSRGDEFADPSHPYSADLDLFGEDSLFQHINRTFGKENERLLAGWLLTPPSSDRTILDRQEATRELAQNIDLLHKFRATAKMAKIDQIDSDTFSKWEKQPPFFKKNTIKWLILAANTFAILLWIGVAFFRIPFSYAFLGFIIQLSVVGAGAKKINDYHNRLGVFMKSFSNYLPLLEVLHSETFTSGQLKAIRQRLFSGPNNALAAFRRLSRLLQAFDQRQNLLAFTFTNGLYTNDLHLILKLDEWNRKYKSHLKEWLDALAETDALMSMANYRINHPGYAEPVPCNSVWFDAERMGHPLIPEEGCIRNDFKVAGMHELYIVTGANMAGKSTFLRTVGINYVLALSGNVVCCKSMRFQRVQLFSSMRTSDNLAKGSSYFHAEINRLKALVEAAGKNERLFIILDEILKGTNSHDKLNGSRLFLKRLLNLPVSGLVATHDLALGELSSEHPGNFNNICFEIENTSEGIIYDYLLRTGISRNMNASALLEQLGLI